jgi:hypothetical protein
MALDDMNEGFLQVTNHKEHPTNKAYKVFFFYSEEESIFFETLLNENNLKYENETDKTGKGTIYLFGIRKTDLTIVGKLNYTTLGKFRKPLFVNNRLKYFVVGLGGFILLIVLISYIMNQ